MSVQIGYDLKIIDHCAPKAEVRGSNPFARSINLSGLYFSITY